VTTGPPRPVSDSGGAEASPSRPSAYWPDSAAWCKMTMSMQQIANHALVETRTQAAIRARDVTCQLLNYTAGAVFLQCETTSDFEVLSKDRASLLLSPRCTALERTCMLRHTDETAGLRYDCASSVTNDSRYKRQRAMHGYKHSRNRLVTCWYSSSARL